MKIKEYIETTFEGDKRADMLEEFSNIRENAVLIIETQRCTGKATVYLFVFREDADEWETIYPADDDYARHVFRGKKEIQNIEFSGHGARSALWKASLALGKLT